MDAAFCRRVAAFVLAIVAAIAPTVRAQDSVRWWIAPALGGGWAESRGGGVAAHFAAGAQKQHVVLSARAATVFDFDGGAGDVSALAGLGTAGDLYHWTASIGVGLNGQDLSGWSFPMELRFSYLAREWIGFGIVAFGAITEGDDFAGVAVSLPLGRLR